MSNTTSASDEVPTPVQVVQYVAHHAEVDAFVALDLEIERQTLGIYISDWLVRLHTATSQILFQYAEHHADAGMRNDAIAKQLFDEEVESMEDVNDWQEWNSRNFEELDAHLQMSPVYKRASDDVLDWASDQEKLIAHYSDIRLNFHYDKQAELLDYWYATDKEHFLRRNMPMYADWNEPEYDSLDYWFQLNPDVHADHTCLLDADFNN